MKRSLFRHQAVHNLSRRYREVVLASAVVGVSTGLVVAAFEKVTAQGCSTVFSIFRCGCR